MTGYGHVVSGYWPATAIGALLVLTLVAWTVVMVRRIHRHKRRPVGDQPAVETPAAQRRAAPSTDSPATNTPVTPRPPGSAESRPTQKERGALLIAEAFLARERLAGRIDAATYRSRMDDLVSGRRP